MHIERTELIRVERACWVFFACLLAVFPISYLNIYLRGFLPHALKGIGFFERLDTMAFFLDQIVFPHGFDKTVGQYHEDKVVIPTSVSLLMSIVLWIVVGFAFAWFVRRLRFRFTTPIAIVTILVVTFAMHAVVYLLSGAEAMMDGP